MREAISRASRTGLGAIDVDATRGEITPALLHTGRRDFLHHVRSLGMEVSALGGDFGRNFSDEDAVEVLFERTERLIGLAIDMKVRIITTRIGRVPTDEKDRKWARLQDVLNEIGARAERYEIYLATHAGESAPADLKKFLDSLDTQGVKVCYDPSVLMPRGLDPVKGVHELGNYIVHTYARDILKGERGYAEVVPGEGIVPFKDYVLALCEVGYDGYHIIKREAGEGRIDDIIKAKEFLERIVG
ncbi:MAG: sugar phosphate isomerase/epimerase family protein [Candidatus Brocadiales bacterium]